MSTPRRVRVLENWSAALGRRRPVQAVVFGLLVSLGCFAVLLRQVDLRQSLAALTHLNGPFLLIPIAVFCFNLPLRAWRWKIIFPASVRPSFSSCLTALGIGNMANFVLPARAGDVARCVLVTPDGALNEGSRALATLAVEKVLDGLALIALVLFSIWALRPPRWVLELTEVATLIFGIALVAMIALRSRMGSFIEYARQRFPSQEVSPLRQKVEVFLISFAEGLGAFRATRELPFILTLTAAIWMSEAGSIWGLAHVLSIPIDMKSAVIASALLGLGLMIPAAPAGLGTYELFGTEAFKLCGVAAAGALALTAVIHAWVFIANIVAGVLLLGLKGIGLAQLRTPLGGDAANVKVQRI